MLLRDWLISRGVSSESTAFCFRFFWRVSRLATTIWESDRFFCCFFIKRVRCGRMEHRTFSKNCQCLCTVSLDILMWLYKYTKWCYLSLSLGGKTHKTFFMWHVHTFSVWAFRSPCYFYSYLFTAHIVGQMVSSPSGVDGDISLHLKAVLLFHCIW